MGGSDGAGILVCLSMAFVVHSEIGLGQSYVTILVLNNIDVNVSS